MITEFNVIEKFFKKNTDVPLGIGDDAALIEKDKDHFWAITQDTLNVNTHFLKNTNPINLGWKSLAVNVSDMFAMGAKPKYAFLSIALDIVENDWLKQFSQGLFKCAKEYGVQLIGGDTTRGKLSISIVLMGEVHKKFVLKRSNAKINDDIWVTNDLGLAAFGLKNLKTQINCPEGLKSKSIKALEKPKPTNITKNNFSRLFHAGIDISDGFIADLGHVLEQSKVGAIIQLDNIPINPCIKTNKYLSCALYGGDDYELILTANKKLRNQILAQSKKLNFQIYNVGEITKSQDLQIHNNKGYPIKLKTRFFRHFK